MAKHPERKPIDFDNIMIPCQKCGREWKLERGKIRTECPYCHRKFGGKIREKYLVSLDKRV